MLKKIFTLLGIAATTLALQSCFDKDYDLEDIDMTIGTTADITLPASSTDSIVLRNIMELEEDGVVQFIKDPSGQEGDSIYAVIQDGKANIQDVNIEKIEITGFTLPDFNAYVDLNAMSSNGSKRKVIINLPGGGSKEVNNTFRYTAKTGDASIKFDHEGSVPCDVRSIDRVTLNDAIATVELTIENVPAWLKYGYLDDVSLRIPNGMKIASAKLNNQTLPSNYITTGNVVLTKGTNYKIDLLEKIKLELVIESLTPGATNGITFTPNANPDLDGTFKAKGDFELLGTFRFTTNDSDVDATILQNEIDNITDPADLAKIATGDLSPLMKDQIHITGPAKFKNDKVAVKTMSGKIRHKVDSIDPIKLDDLPDFLNDDEVVLDIQNPIILIKAQHGLPYNATTAISLTSTIGSQSYTIKANNISVPGSMSVNNFYVADEAVDDAILPNNYKAATKLAHTGDSVKKLIEKIPDQIDVTVDPVELDVVDFDITKPYKVKVEYEVFAPLYIGQDFMLVYRDTDRGWAKDMDDLEDLNFDKIQLTAEAYSDMPADLILKLEPLDVSGNVLPNLTTQTIEIPAKAQQHKISIDLEAIGKTASGKNATINDVLTGKDGVKQLDGIRYEARIKGNAATNGAALPQEANIQLKKILITIKGGVSFDAN